METIKLPGHATPVALAQLMYLRSENNYTWFFLASGQRLLASLHLGYYQTQLADFLRIHKCVMVNPDYVLHIERMGYLEATLTMQDATRWPIAKRRLRATLTHLRQRATQAPAEVVF